VKVVLGISCENKSIVSSSMFVTSIHPSMNLEYKSSLGDSDVYVSRKKKLKFFNIKKPFVEKKIRQVC
jgi:hypothetical protein